MRYVLALVALLALIAAGVYVASGWVSPPAVQIVKPEKAIGRTAPLDVTVEAPGGRFSRVEIAIEQEGRRLPLFSLATAATSGATAVRQEGLDRLRIQRTLTRKDVPDLRPGAARVVVTAARVVLYGVRTLETTATRDVRVRFDPPRLSVLSMHHYVNHGGSEMVAYRVTPPEVESGVRVGDVSYPGYPASGAGVPDADASVHVAFFALLHDQDLNAPIELYAVDDAGNRARAAFEHRIFPKPFRRSRIELDDAFLGRVVPAIVENTPELERETTNEDVLAVFLEINRDLRRKNGDAIRARAAKSAPRILWQGPFHQLTNSQVESSFADHRTYFYKGQEVDRQVHLGFDLAVTANVPVVAANHGTVLLAQYLGIYGNTVVIDHGLGVQSLYGHLSSFDVKEGDEVRREQPIGRSGMTGLAGGDHLHFTMLLHGRPVTPVEWWDAHWIEDRIARKLRALGTLPPAQ